MTNTVFFVLLCPLTLGKISDVYYMW